MEIAFPKTIPQVAEFLESQKASSEPPTQSQLIAMMVYTAEKAKFSNGDERQKWTGLFIDTFKMVHADIVGDSEALIGLC